MQYLTVRVSNALFEELERKHDDLFAWAKDRPALFVELDQYEAELSSIMAEFPRLVDTKKGKSGADPMVISLALSHNPRLVVVTEEAFGSERSPRIPDVCGKRDLRCINMLQFIRDQEWKF